KAGFGITPSARRRILTLHLAEFRLRGAPPSKWVTPRQPSGLLEATRSKAALKMFTVLQLERRLIGFKRDLWGRVTNQLFPRSNPEWEKTKFPICIRMLLFLTTNYNISSITPG